MLHDSEESSALIPQLPEVHIYNSIYDLDPEGLIHFDRILLYSLSFVMFKLELL